MSYKFLSDVSIADVAFEAEGKTIEELFVSSGLAVTNTMVRDLKTVKQKVSKRIKLEYDNVEKLLFNFLQEFVYWKDTKSLLFSKIIVKIKEKKGTYYLSAVLKGEKLNMKKHELLVDVKAVTMHLFEVKHDKNWTAKVVLDV